MTGPDEIRTVAAARHAPSLFGGLRSRLSLKAILVILVALALAAGTFVVAGGINVAADEPDSWLAAHLLHFVFKRSVSSRSSNVIPPPDLDSPARVRLAAQHFDMVCANCHGRPGYGQSVTALSMNPQPQYLPKVLGQFTDAELYQIVEHGVRYSAMPSWPTASRGDEVWSMVSFLRQLPKLDAAEYRAMTALPKQENPALAPARDDATLRPANVQHNAGIFDEILSAAPASGFSDRGIHASPVATCARCHGEDGTGAVTGGEAPNLTIQEPAYLRAALESYTSGRRKSGFMQNIAAQLSAAQIEALADYYARLPVRTVVSPAPRPELVSRGEAIATGGIRERALPPCANCHEGSGARLTGAPHIAGQSVLYLSRQLAALRRGDRGSSIWWNPMPAVAHDLADGDIDALAAYYSTLSPAKGSDAAKTSASAGIKPPPAMGAADLAQTKALFEANCLKCHADGGRGEPEGRIPNLTIQSSPYLAQALYSFRTRARPNEKMQSLVDSLSFDQLTSLADYVASLPAQPGMAKIDGADAARGEQIASHGDPARGLPACLSCHDAGGTTDLPIIPRLQGQSAPYLRARLDNFAAGYEIDRSALNPMPTIAGKLSGQERADLAAWFAAIPPLAKTAAQP